MHLGTLGISQCRKARVAYALDWHVCLRLVNKTPKSLEFVDPRQINEDGLYLTGNLTREMFMPHLANPHVYQWTKWLKFKIEVDPGKWNFVELRIRCVH